MEGNRNYKVSVFLGKIIIIKHLHTIRVVWKDCNLELNHSTVALFTYNMTNYMAYASILPCTLFTLPYTIGYVLISGW